MDTVSFNVPSISCSACQNKIQKGIQTLKGIKNVAVDLKTQTVNVDYNPSEIEPGDISKKISSLGYEVMQ